MNIVIDTNVLLSGDKDLLEATLSIQTRMVSVAQFAAQFAIAADSEGEGRS